VFDTDRIRTTFASNAQKRGVTIETLIDERRSTVPTKRLGHPDEFGAICAFLCSQHAGYVNGQNILADGGAYPGTF
jgi:3-oxoacyl-[acyl-carrier protein] reductase